MDSIKIMETRVRIFVYASKSHANEISKTLHRKRFGKISLFKILQWQLKHICEYKQEKLFFILLIMLLENFKEHRNQLFVLF